MKTITSLTVIAKEWFDKVNGNSYFSAQITVNNDHVIKIPFQYGYDRMYIQQTFNTLTDYGYECGRGWNIEKYCNENKIPHVFVKHEKCLQRDVKAWGNN